MSLDDLDGIFIPKRILNFHENIRKGHFIKHENLHFIIPLLYLDERNAVSSDLYRKIYIHIFRKYNREISSDFRKYRVPAILRNQDSKRFHRILQLLRNIR